MLGKLYSTGRQEGSNVGGGGGSGEDALRIAFLQQHRQLLEDHTSVFLRLFASYSRSTMNVLNVSQQGWGTPSLASGDNLATALRQTKAAAIKHLNPDLSIEEAVVEAQTTTLGGLLATLMAEMEKILRNVDFIMHLVAVHRFSFLLPVMFPPETSSSTSYKKSSSSTALLFQEERGAIDDNSSSGSDSSDDDEKNEEEDRKRLRTMAEKRCLDASTSWDLRHASISLNAESMFAPPGDSYADHTDDGIDGKLHDVAFHRARKQLPSSPGYYHRCFDRAVAHFTNASMHIDASSLGRFQRFSQTPPPKRSLGAALLRFQKCLEMVVEDHAHRSEQQHIDEDDHSSSSSDDDDVSSDESASGGGGKRHKSSRRNEQQEPTEELDWNAVAPRVAVVVEAALHKVYRRHFEAKVRDHFIRWNCTVVTYQSIHQQLSAIILEACGGASVLKGGGTLNSTNATENDLVTLAPFLSKNENLHARAVKAAQRQESLSTTLDSVISTFGKHSVLKVMEDSGRVYFSATRAAIAQKKTHHRPNEDSALLTLLSPTSTTMRSAVGAAVGSTTAMARRGSFVGDNKSSRPSGKGAAKGQQGVSNNSILISAFEQGVQNAFSALADTVVLTPLNSIILLGYSMRFEQRCETSIDGAGIFLAPSRSFSQPAPHPSLPALNSPLPSRATTTTARVIREAYVPLLQTLHNTAMEAAAQPLRQVAAALESLSSSTKGASSELDGATVYIPMSRAGKSFSSSSSSSNGPVWQSIIAESLLVHSQRTFASIYRDRNWPEAHVMEEFQRYTINMKAQIARKNLIPFTFASFRSALAPPPKKNSSGNDEDGGGTAKLDPRIVAVEWRRLKKAVAKATIAGSSAEHAQFPPEWETYDNAPTTTKLTEETEAVLQTNRRALPMLVDPASGTSMLSCVTLAKHLLLKCYRLASFVDSSSSIGADGGGSSSSGENSLGRYLVAACAESVIADVLLEPLKSLALLTARGSMAGRCLTEAFLTGYDALAERNGGPASPTSTLGSHSSPRRGLAAIQWETLTHPDRVWSSHHFVDAELYAYYRASNNEFRTSGRQYAAASAGTIDTLTQQTPSAFGGANNAAIGTAVSEVADVPFHELRLSGGDEAVVRLALLAHSAEYLGATMACAAKIWVEQQQQIAAARRQEPGRGNVARSVGQATNNNNMKKSNAASTFGSNGGVVGHLPSRLFEVMVGAETSVQMLKGFVPMSAAVVANAPPSSSSSSANSSLQNSSLVLRCKRLDTIASFCLFCLSTEARFLAIGYLPQLRDESYHLVAVATTADVFVMEYTRRLRTMFDLMHTYLLPSRVRFSALSLAWPAAEVVLMELAQLRDKRVTEAGMLKLQLNLSTLQSTMQQLGTPPPTSTLSSARRWSEGVGSRGAESLLSVRQSYDIAEAVTDYFSRPSFFVRNVRNRNVIADLFSGITSNSSAGPVLERNEVEALLGLVFRAETNDSILIATNLTLYDQRMSSRQEPALKSDDALLIPLGPALDRCGGGEDSPLRRRLATTTAPSSPTVVAKTVSLGGNGKQPLPPISTTKSSAKSQIDDDDEDEEDEEDEEEEDEEEEDEEDEEPQQVRPTGAAVPRTSLPSPPTTVTTRAAVANPPVVAAAQKTPQVAPAKKRKHPHRLSAMQTL
ncbi:Hypothetical protein, putative [Bodo saltans]|uniref:Exocyst complex component Sec8 n=1 Tax=Bodo saltans TaxID=75058 RepID=A0A0S4JL47_BODSA|nr:Hypothetical protein, putative [Bodo saltans]|eukprot:CUG90963.1 Hypothetical protein, putative [Bodo saltans]